MKKFITTISLQGFDLKPQLYKAIDNPALELKKETAFPIIAAINSSVEKGEKIKVYPIIIKDVPKDSTEDKVAEKDNNNYKTFLSELDELKKEKGFDYEVEPIYKNGSDDVDTLISTFLNIIDIPEDNDEISACITYGTKAIPVLTIMGLRYAYKVKKDVEIRNIVYGRRMWDGSGSEIYDMKPLFYIDSAVDNIAKMNMTSPEEFLKLLLSDFIK